MEKQEVKEYLKKQYPKFKGFIEHTLVAEMAMNFANMQQEAINYTRSCETLPIDEIKDWHIKRWSNGLENGASMTEIREDMISSKKAMKIYNSLKEREVK